MTEPKLYRDDRTLRWKVWWRFGFPPVIRFVTFLPIAEWRKERWLWAVDTWAMNHIGRAAR